MTRFLFNRTRKAIYWETRWFWLRFYPLILPRWEIHWTFKGRRAR